MHAVDFDGPNRRRPSVLIQLDTNTTSHSKHKDMKERSFLTPSSPPRSYQRL